MAIGALLASPGRLEEAMAALAPRAAAGDEDLSPRAALLLGGLLGTRVTSLAPGRCLIRRSPPGTVMWRRRGA